MEKKKRGRPVGRPKKAVKAILEEKGKFRGKVDNEEVIDVKAIPVPVPETPSQVGSGTPLPSPPDPTVDPAIAEDMPKIQIYRVTPENRDEMVHRMYTRLVDMKNLVMAVLGSGQSTLSRKDQELVFAILRSVDSAGLKAKLLKEKLTSGDGTSN